MVREEGKGDEDPRKGIGERRETSLLKRKGEERAGIDVQRRKKDGLSALTIKKRESGKRGKICRVLCLQTIRGARGVQKRGKGSWNDTHTPGRDEIFRQERNTRGRHLGNPSATKTLRLSETPVTTVTELRRTENAGHC